MKNVLSFIKHQTSEFNITFHRRRTDGLFLLGFGSILLSVGLLFGEPSHNFNALEGLLPMWVWSVLFATYGFVKVLTSFFLNSFTVRLLNEILGIWLWTYLSLSFLFYDKSSMTPTELLIVLPVILAAWNIVSLLNDKIENKG